jgi:hypothetical protein
MRFKALQFRDGYMEEDQLEEGHSETSTFEEADAERSSRWVGKALAVLVIAAAIVFAGWMLGHPRAVLFSTPYQAVLLSNGEFFFGHLEGYGTGVPVLTEVYYVQSTVDPQTKQQNNVLLKRGKEWHGPDRMYINPQQIVMVEPVDPDSRVGALIANSKLKK